MPSSNLHAPSGRPRQRSRPRLFAVVVAFLLACATVAPPRAALRAQDDARGAREFIGDFYHRLADDDTASFAAVWAADATDRPGQLLAHRRLHVMARQVAVRDLTLTNLEVTETSARADVVYWLAGSPARAGDPLSGFGTKRRVIECVLAGGRWLVKREFAAEELLADRVEQAPAADRLALVREHPGWVPRDLVYVLLTRAMRDRSRGQAAAGLALADLARTIADESGDPDARARALEALGIFASAAGDTARAIEMNDAAQAIDGVSPDTRAIVLNSRGVFHSQRSQGEQARAAYIAAIGIREAAGLGALNGGLVGNLAILAQLRSDYDEASRQYRAALVLDEALGDDRGMTTNLSNLGTVEHERGNYREAQAIYERVLSRAVASGNKDLEALALNNIGLVYRLQGRLDLSRDYLSRALAMREAAGERARVASTLQNLGMVERLEGRHQAALDLFARSLALHEQADDKVGQALVHNSIGSAYDTLHRYDEAIASFTRSLEIAERVGNRSRMVQALANIAITERTRGGLDRAAAAAERTIAIAREIGNREQLLSALTTLGQVLTDQGHPARAQQVLDEAITVVEGMRDDAGASAQEQQRFLESRTSPFEALVAVHVGQGDAAAALAAAERAKARVLLDVLSRGRVTLTGAMTADERAREASLDEALRTLNTDVRRERARTPPDPSRLASLEAQLRQARLDYDSYQARLYALYPLLGVQRGRAPTFSLADADALVPDAGAAAIEYLVGANSTQLFVATRAPGGGAVQVAVVTLPLGREALSAQVTTFRDAIASRDLGIREHARALFDTILAPAYAHLEGRRTIVVVPDGALWDVPFQALVSNRGRFLVEDHAFAYAPSLTVLREMRRLAGARPARTEATLFALGNPVIAPATASSRVSTLMDGGGFAPLPEAEQQVRRLGELYGRSRSAVFVGADAREQRAKRDAGRYSVMHLATHGVLDDHSPMYSYVVLAPDATRDGDDGVLEAREIMNLRLASDLVVLSACETGRGRFGRGEGVIGMAWALFVAGVPATVVSQWKVDAASTSDLMVAFHRALRAPTTQAGGLAKAMALQRASREVLADARYRHPFYWAGFVVIGDAR